MMQSNSTLQVFIVRNHLPYEQLATLSNDLRNCIGQSNIVITKAHYRMLPQLIDSIKRQENNLLILLTSDIQLDGNLQQQLNEINKKNVKVVLYPEQLSKDNNYFIAKRKDEIVNVISMYFNKLKRKSTNLDQMILGQNMSNNLQQYRSSPRASQLNQHQPIIASSFKPLSQIANQVCSPIGVFVFRSKDIQFNKTMNILFNKHKTNPLVNFQQIQSFHSLQSSINQKQILIISQKQANQIQNLAPYLNNLNSKIYAIRFLDKKGIRKPNANFQFQTNKIEDIEYLIDNSLSKYNHNLQHQNNFNKQNNRFAEDQNQFSNRLTQKSTGRIQMKSAKKIHMFPQSNQDLFVYGRHQSSDFQQFYSSLPYNPKVVNDFNNIKSQNPIILASSQACPLIFSQIPNNCKLILYSNTLTPEIMISHPLISMITSNKNQLMCYLQSQNIQTKSINNPFVTIPVLNSPPIQSYVSNNKIQPNNNSYSNWTLNNQFTTNNNWNSKQQVLIQQPKIFKQEINDEQNKGNNAIFSNQIKGNLKNGQIKNKNNDYSQKYNNKMMISPTNQPIQQIPNQDMMTLSQSITPARIQQFVIKSSKKQRSSGQSYVDSTIKDDQSKISAFRSSKLQGQKSQIDDKQIDNYNMENGNKKQQIVFTLQNNASMQRSSVPNIIINSPPISQNIIISDDRTEYFPQSIIKNNNIIQQSKSLKKQPKTDKIKSNNLSNQVSIKVIHQVLPQLKGNTIQTQTTQTLINKQSISNNMMTFQDFSQKQRKTQSGNNGEYVNNLYQQYQANYDMSYSLPSIPERIYTQKAISCNFIQTPQKQMQINSLNLASSEPHIHKIPQVIESLEYQVIIPEPIKIKSSSNQIIYGDQQTIFINQHLGKKKQSNKICSGVYQIRTEKQAQTVIQQMYSSTFINNTSGTSSYQPLAERIMIESPPQQVLTQVNLPPVHLTSTKTSQLPQKPQIISRQSFVFPEPIVFPQSIVPISNNRVSSIFQMSESQSFQPQIQRHSYSVQTNRKSPPTRLSNIVTSSRVSQQIPQLQQTYSPKRESNSLQLNELNFDMRVENGVKVYKRKSSSVDPKTVQYTQPRQSVNIRSSYFQRNQQNKPLTILKQQQNSYYNNENINFRNSLNSIQPKILQHNHINSRNSVKVYLNNDNSIKQNRSSQFNKSNRISGLTENLVTTRTSQLLRNQSLTISNSSTSFVVKILCHDSQQNLQKSISTRLKNKACVQTYSDQQSLIQKVLQNRGQNLIVVLNEQFSIFQQQLEQIHPNISIITFSKAAYSGTNLTSSVPEVLSLIQKWYFKY